MHIRAFFRDLFEDWGADYMGDLQDLLCRHGLLERRPLTKDDLDAGGSYDGAGEGDDWLFPTPAFEAWLNQEESA